MPIMNIVTALKSQADYVNATHFLSNEWLLRMSDLTGIPYDWLLNNLATTYYSTPLYKNAAKIDELKRLCPSRKFRESKLVWHVTNRRFVDGEDVTGKFEQFVL